jgi:hypothetical protein
MIDITIFSVLAATFEEERKVELDHFQRTRQLLPSPYRRTRKALRKALQLSEQHPEISIPNQSHYLFGATELSERLYRLIVAGDYGFQENLAHALQALVPESSATDRLEALITILQ